MKNVVVAISGLPPGENLRELELSPGTRVSDALRAMNLQGYVLSREGSGQVFANEEDLYAMIEDGAKLRAAAVAEVGE